MCAGMQLGMVKVVRYVYKALSLGFVPHYVPTLSRHFKGEVKVSNEIIERQGSCVLVNQRHITRGGDDVQFCACDGDAERLT